ncbi:unnamed protein product [Cochlearia groenlandica]
MDRLSGPPGFSAPPGFSGPPGFSAPPGFVSQTTFVLRSIVNRDKESSKPVVSRQEQETGFGIDDADGFKIYLKNRPWILHDRTTPSSEGLKPMKSEVWARRLPRVSESEKLDEAPVFNPTEEEFKDTLSYIASLRERAEPYGICCVVPPPSWQPPCLLKEKKIWEDSKFVTQLQLFDGIPTESPKIKKEPDVDSDDDAAASEKTMFCRIERGPRHSLKSFKKSADVYKKKNFSFKEELLGSKNLSPPAKPKEPTVEEIEKEYRQLFESPLFEIGVLYGNDLVTTTFGSGFPLPGKSESCNYKTSGWNLNNTAKLPGSLLSFEDSESVCVPRLSVGMYLSSQLWKSEKERLYSLSYLHMGAPRVWYVVAGCHRSKFRDTMKRLIPEMSEDQSKKSHESVKIMSPYALSIEGIPVTRCVQNPGQYVIIFPGSYYCAVDCGFNCLEKVNFAPLDWLPHGDIAVQQNQEKSRRSSVSYDKLLLSAAKDAVNCLKENSLSKKKTAWCDSCRKDGMFSNIVKSRVKQEKSRRKFLSSSLKSQKIDEKSYDAVRRRECCECFADLHLSAVQCLCSPGRYWCLRHTRKLLRACPEHCDKQRFLYRYTNEEMDLLVDALEGKLSSMLRWGYRDLNKISQAEDKETEEEKTRLTPKVRSIADIMSVEDETEDVKSCSKRSCDSSVVNTITKKHKHGS